MSGPGAPQWGVESHQILLHLGEKDRRGEALAKMDVNTPSRFVAIC